MLELVITHRLHPETAALIASLVNAPCAATPAEAPAAPTEAPAGKAKRQPAKTTPAPEPEVTPEAPAAPAATSPEDIKTACRILIDAGMKLDMDNKVKPSDPASYRQKVLAAVRDVQPESEGRLSRVSDDNLPAVLAALQEVVPQ